MFCVLWSVLRWPAAAAQKKWSPTFAAVVFLELHEMFLCWDYDVPCPRCRLLWRTVWDTYVPSLSFSSVCFLSQLFSFESQASHFPTTDSTAFTGNPLNRFKYFHNLQTWVLSTNCHLNLRRVLPCTNGMVWMNYQWYRTSLCHSTVNL